MIGLEEIGATEAVIEMPRAEYDLYVSDAGALMLA